MTVNNIKNEVFVEDDKDFNNLHRMIEDAVIKYKDANKTLDELDLIHLFDRVGLHLFKDSWSHYKKTDIILDHILSET
jgi:hypothetical protein